MYMEFPTNLPKKYRKGEFNFENEDIEYSFKWQMMVSSLMPEFSFLSSEGNGEFGLALRYKKNGSFIAGDSPMEILKEKLDSVGKTDTDEDEVEDVEDYLDIDPENRELLTVIEDDDIAIAGFNNTLEAENNPDITCYTVLIACFA